MDVGLLNVSVSDVAPPCGKIGGHRHQVGLAGLNLAESDKRLDFIAILQLGARGIVDQPVAGTESLYRLMLAVAQLAKAAANAGQYVVFCRDADPVLG